MASCCCHNTSTLIFLLFLVSFVHADFNIGNLSTGDGGRRLENIRAHLRKINKPAVKTIQSPDGDIIDCVLIHQQPAFDNPLLKEHKLLDSHERLKRNKLTTAMHGENFQVWHLSNESCPQGTIPIRRTTKQDLLRATSVVQRFGRKRRPIIVDGAAIGHEHAIARTTGQYYGAQAFFNVWAPATEVDDEFSLAQIWVAAGSYEGHDLNSIEAGWQVFPIQYNDNAPRLFIYWTRDAYEQTGCYNLLCEGFVQTNNMVALGGAIAPVSTYNAEQFDIGLHIYKDQNGNAWWLEFGGEKVGYWPSSLFTSLSDGFAETIDFGGEVMNTQASGGHTTTQMGSGHYASEGYGKAAFIRNLQVVNTNHQLINAPPGVQLITETPSCYTIESRPPSKVPGWGVYVYYGGPGRNSMCH